MKIAVITPWFSDSISGGAERFAGGIAKSLQDAGNEVEILTTCGKDSFWPWDKDFYKEGKYQIEDYTIRRFSLRSRNKQLYDELMGKLISNKELTYIEEMQLLLETVNSDSLNQFIAENAANYVFLFIPYLYGTTYWGSKLVPERSFIIPCMHDEDMAYFKVIGDMFKRTAGIMFNTIEEQQFTAKIHNISINDTIVSGGGVEVNFAPNPGAFKKKYGISDDYFIYVGRQVTGKNVPQLIEFFNNFSQKNKGTTKLLFVGQGEDQIIEMIKSSPNIVQIGELNDQEKYDAIAGSLALIQPSLMESFSIVIMESWLCDTPVIVHELCEVTKGHCERSKGGLYYKDMESFNKVLNKYIDSPDLLTEMGKHGREYVEHYYTWAKTAERILAFLKSKGFVMEEFSE
ncbi:glycosyltransferase family 4 protein [Paenibacillus sp. PL91]|uniref:glycosyltransferase family 4 protein n=1 Tax=Paenibacillus sp. PL91 TaxID=2729538 RepID=UPI00145F5D27|nr:glycosyltransferase family 4 protein [Paenibacillus sp. PL91]MBC9200436.1 glycosyltransferase family 4 protein [Paenibacillus sp. PL91]